MKYDLLVKNASFLKDGEVKKNMFFLIKDGNFFKINGMENLTDEIEKKAEETIDFKNFFITPPFFNAHTHIAMSYFKGVADDIPLKEWLEKHIWPLEAKHIKKDFVYESSYYGICELIKSGCLYFSDMYFFEDETARAALDAGVKCVIGEGIIGFPAPARPDPDSAFDILKNQVEKYKENENIFVAAAAHSVYTTAPAQLKKCVSLIEKYNVPFHIHISETESENAECLKLHGKTPAEYINDLGLLTKNTAAAHCVHLSEKDIKLFSKAGASVIHCPESNLKLGSGIAPVSNYIDAGINVCLGTDGSASNNNLNMIEEMSTAAKLQKGLFQNPEKMNFKQAFQCASFNGVKAYELDDILGTIEEGKKADFIAFNFDDLFSNPYLDALPNLVYSASASNVKYVYSSGKCLLKNGALTFADEKELIKKAACFRGKIFKD